MNKKPIARLKLHRESLRYLDSPGLAKAAAGVTVVQTNCQACTHTVVCTVCHLC